MVDSVPGHRDRLERGLVAARRAGTNADTHHAAAEPAAALDDWRQAWRILTELRHPDADQLRARIDRTSR